MPDRQCSERTNDILIAELKRMTKEAREYLDSKKEEFLKLKNTTNISFDVESAIIMNGIDQQNGLMAPRKTFSFSLQSRHFWERDRSWTHQVPRPPL